MNYGRTLEQIHYEEFINVFNEENKSSNVTWNNVYIKIKKMVKELFISVKRTHPEMHFSNVIIQ